VPPRGLTRAGVVDAAAALADRDGAGAVTLAAVAAEVGVRTPSLYNHVDGLAGLQRELALRGMTALGDRLRRATVGVAGREAVQALAAAYRRFALDHPGLYASTVAAPRADDAALQAVAAEVVEVVTTVLAGFGVEDEAAVHAARALRSLLHGVVVLQQAGGFGLDVDLEASVRWAVDRLVDGLGGPRG
jgi:AcrR family transcriptional regulator